jgi:hypothetical protein
MTENAAQKLAATLIERELVREIRAKPGMPAWRRSEEGRSQALVLTKLGRAAIKVVNDRQPEDTELGVETSASSEGLKAHKAAPDGKGPITIGAWLRYAEQRVPQLYDDIQAGRIQAVKVEAANDAARSLTKEPIIDPAFRDQIANPCPNAATVRFLQTTKRPCSANTLMKGTSVCRVSEITKNLGQILPVLFFIISYLLLTHGGSAAAPTIQIVPQVGHSFGVQTIHVVSGELRFISAGGEGTLKIWDLKTESLVRTVVVGGELWTASHRRLQGRSSDPLARRLRQAGRDLRCP